MERYVLSSRAHSVDFILIVCDDTSYAWLLIEFHSTGVSSRVIRWLFLDANVRSLSEAHFWFYIAVDTCIQQTFCSKTLASSSSPDLYTEDDN